MYRRHNGRLNVSGGAVASGHGDERGRSHLAVAALTIGVWTLHVLLTYGRVGLNGTVPLGLIWPRVGAITLASLFLCPLFLIGLERVRKATPAAVVAAIAVMAVCGGLLMGGAVALFALFTDDTRYSLVTQFASAGIYWIWVYFAWSLGVFLLQYRHLLRNNPVAASFAPSAQPEPEFWVTQNRNRIRVRPSEVLWIESAGDYVMLHTSERAFMMHASISSLAAQLERGEFMRVHRGAIVNLAMVAGVNRGSSGDFVLRLSGGSTVKVGRSYKSEVRSALRMRS